MRTEATRTTRLVDRLSQFKAGFRQRVAPERVAMRTLHDEALS